MVSLLDLPEEILIYILRLLDTKSVYNLYTTCQNMKTIINMQGVIRTCNLSLNTLSTSRSLQLGMIKDIAGHLYELNMCAVPDLRKGILLPAIKRMKCLKTLDVSYTSITLLDLLDLYKNCPTIKNISINVDVMKIAAIPDQIIEECQDLFTNFTNVHFVLTSLLSYFPLNILTKSSLNTLTYTLCDQCQDCMEQEDKQMVPFNNFCLYIMNCTLTWRKLRTILPTMNLETTEYIVLEYINTICSLWSSHKFVKFFTENFNITPKVIFERDKFLRGNIVMLLWNKETTKFDESFYYALKRKIKQIFTHDLEISSEKPLTSDRVIKGYEWINLKVIEPGVGRSQMNELPQTFKKRRVVATDYVLDCDNLFSEHDHINVLIYFSMNRVINLSSTNNYLKKIRYLCLSGKFFRFSSEFFNILFRCCDNLITLHVIASSLSPCSSAIVRSVYLSQRLKNIRLVDKKIDCKTLFSSFSLCKQLQNICIEDTSRDCNDLADPTAMYVSCTNLYNLYITAQMKSSVEKKFCFIMNSLIKKHSPLHHVNYRLVNTIKVPYNLNRSHRKSYDPYVGTFGLNWYECEEVSTFCLHKYPM